MAKGNNLGECLRMVEHREIDLRLSVGSEWYLFQSFLHLMRSRNTKARQRDDAAQGIDIIPGYLPAEKSCLDHCRPPAHERIVNKVPRLSITLDEVARKLRFEAGAVRDLVQRRSLTLA
jgi:hypothetical protein